MVGGGGWYVYVCVCVRVYTCVVVTKTGRRVYVRRTSLSDVTHPWYDSEISRNGTN